MKAFIDTSSLMKKYVDEKGSDELDSLLKKITDIIVSPIYNLEVHSAIERRLKDNTLTLKEASFIREEIKKDYQYFSKIIWNNNLEEKSLQMIGTYSLRTLDSIQLASACLSNADVFITSDEGLLGPAKKELKNVRFL